MVRSSRLTVKLEVLGLIYISGYSHKAGTIKVRKGAVCCFVIPVRQNHLKYWAGLITGVSILSRAIGGGRNNRARTCGL